MKRYSLLFAALVLLLGSWLISRQLQTAGEMNAGLAAAKRKHKELGSLLAQARHSLEHPSTNAGQKASAGSASTEIASDASAADGAKQRQRLQWLAASTHLHYAALYRKLGLSSEQIAQCEHLQQDYLQACLDIWDSARAQNVSVNDPAVRSLLLKEAQQLNQSEIALLGDAAVQEMLQYDRTTQARSVANTIAGNVYFTATPLTVEQGDKITQIFANNSASYQKGGIADLNDVNVPAALAQAQAVLAPAQLAALTTYLQGRTSSSSLQSRISALTQPLSAPAP